MSPVLSTRARSLVAAATGAAALAAVAAVGVPSETPTPVASAVVSARADDALGHKEAHLVALDSKVERKPRKEFEVVVAAAEEVEPAPEPTEPSRSVWDDVADCESGSWTGDGGFVRGSATWDSTAGLFEGGLQFHPDTWDGFRDSGMPSAAYDASREQQIAVAERVLAAQGWEAWPVCSRKLGLR